MCTLTRGETTDVVWSRLRVPNNRRTAALMWAESLARTLAAACFDAWQCPSLSERPAWQKRTATCTRWKKGGTGQQHHANQGTGHRCQGTMWTLQ